MSSFLWAPVLLVGPFGATELLIIFGIVLLIFGGSRLGRLGKGLGEGIRNFRSSMKGVTNPDTGSEGGDSSAKEED